SLPTTSSAYRSDARFGDERRARQPRAGDERQGGRGRNGEQRPGHHRGAEEGDRPRLAPADEREQRRGRGEHDRFERERAVVRERVQQRGRDGTRSLAGGDAEPERRRLARERERVVPEPGDEP